MIICWIEVELINANSEPNVNLKFFNREDRLKRDELTTELKHKQDVNRSEKQQKHRDTRQQDWLWSSSLMDYVSESTFKMGVCFIRVESEEVDYTET